MFSAWALLMVAVCTEIAWGCSLKAITFCDFGRWFAAVPVLLSFLNMYLLARVMRELPAGVTYAVWMSLGSVGLLVAGMVLFGERLSAWQLFFAGLCFAGVVGLKLCPGA